jgi:hypothetical protein
MIKKGRFFCILEYNEFSSTVLCVSSTSIVSIDDILSWDIKKLPITNSNSNYDILVTKFFFSCVVSNDYVLSLSQFDELDNSFVLPNSYDSKLDISIIRTAIYNYWFLNFIYMFHFLLFRIIHLAEPFPCGPCEF